MKKQDDLGKETVIVHDNSFSHNYLIGKGMGNKAIPYDDMKEEVIHVNACDSGQVLWNTLSLKWLKNHYKLDNLTLTPIDVASYTQMSNYYYYYGSSQTVVTKISPAVSQPAIAKLRLDKAKIKVVYSKQSVY